MDYRVLSFSTSARLFLCQIERREPFFFPRSSWTLCEEVEHMSRKTIQITEEALGTEETKQLKKALHVVVFFCSTTLNPMVQEMLANQFESKARDLRANLSIR